ncbi:MAG: hypothetical protein GF350_02855 [Chitinivibrionales bacterium]|nr:hypothetical protein [Chitinivibrionales bacterium]
MNYSWPGNVRELRNMLERAILLANGKKISIEHFPGMETWNRTNTSSDTPRNLEEIEKMHIVKVLQECNGDKNKACKALGMSLSSLYRRLGKIG